MSKANARKAEKKDEREARTPGYLAARRSRQGSRQGSSHLALLQAIFLREQIVTQLCCRARRRRPASCTAARPSAAQARPNRPMRRRARLILATLGTRALRLRFTIFRNGTCSKTRATGCVRACARVCDCGAPPVARASPQAVGGASPRCHTLPVNGCAK